jgi:hypothetical protein
MWASLFFSQYGYIDIYTVSQRKDVRVFILSISIVHFPTLIAFILMVTIPLSLVLEANVYVTHILRSIWPVYSC